MLDTSRTALGGASPKQRQIGSGAPSARTGGPAASASAPVDQSPAPRVSKAPPGFDAASRHQGHQEAPPLRPLDRAPDLNVGLAVVDHPNWG